jgi:thiol-disulfide isomerase/thioredoxin
VQEYCYRHVHDGSVVDPYFVMGLGKEATQDEIKKTYRKLSRTWHPDKNEGDEFATKVFAAISTAYGILGDADRRDDHDNFGVQNKGYQTKDQWERHRSGDGADDFYRGSSLVVSLDDTNWDEHVNAESDPQTWLVEFYAPWCTHCIEMRDDLKEAASRLEGIAYVGAVNCEKADKNFCGERHRINSYPTIRLFIPAQGHEETYTSDKRDADGFYAFTKKAARLSDRAAVQAIATEAEFNIDVLNSTKFWVVLFNDETPTRNCRLCRIASGLMRHLSASVKATAGVGRVNCAEVGENARMHELCLQHMGVRSSGEADSLYPHIRLYQTGLDKTKGESVWNGAYRSAEELHLSMQVLERISRLSLAKVEPEAAVALKEDDEPEAEEDEEMPPPPPEDDHSFPDAPPARPDAQYIQYGGNYQPPAAMIGS